MLLADAGVAIELEHAGNDDVVALLAAVRQAVLIWRTVVVVLPPGSGGLGDACEAIGEELRPRQGAVAIRQAPSPPSGLVLHIGPTASGDPRVVTVTNS